MAFYNSYYFAVNCCQALKIYIVGMHCWANASRHLRLWRIKKKIPNLVYQYYSTYFTDNTLFAGQTYLQGQALFLITNIYLQFSKTLCHLLQVRPKADSAEESGKKNFFLYKWKSSDYTLSIYRPIWLINTHWWSSL